MTIIFNQPGLHKLKLVILQFHTSNVWKEAYLTIFIQFQKKTIEKRDSN